jgi:uncharacterized protein YdhG (YjbR/CyaY superfamily)
MPKVRVTTIDEYIAMQPAPTQVVLERVRATIAKSVPDAEECISYGIPAFRFNRRILLYFAGWTEHYSIYPASDLMVTAFEGALDEYRVSKGTLRFLLSKPVPVRLIGRIAEFRAQELGERKKTDTPAAAKAPKKR